MFYMLKTGDFMNKKQIIEKYFDNKISPKSLHKFKNKTPQGNFVSGWLCREPGEFLSSMLLTEIQTKNKTIKCERFLRGMPKQHYYDQQTWSLDETTNFSLYHCLEKVDGTCLMLYTIYDEEENLIEIVPRTRGMAVASNHILEMFKLIDSAQIEDFYKYPHNLDVVLMFELYGILNRHEITDYRHYIDIVLIGATEYNKVFDYTEVRSIAFRHHFLMPDFLFSILFADNKWSISPEISKLYPYYAKKEYFDKKYSSLSDCISGLGEIIEIINNNYQEKNGHVAIEGVVINGLTEDGTQRYVKIKPLSILKMARLGNGIPRYAIRKEVYKYFDEYGVVKVTEIYNNDKLHFMKFVKKNLLEEFPIKIVDSAKTSKKINNIFFEIWENKTPDLNVQKIAQELAEKYSDKPKSEIMKIFATEYPSFKKKSRQVYSILNYLVKEDK